MADPTPREREHHARHPHAKDGECLHGYDEPAYWHPEPTPPQPTPTVTAEQVEAARGVIERYERAADAAQKSGEVEYPVVVGEFARQLRDALGLGVQP